MKKKDTRILLVDDEPDILEILEYNISSEGYKVKRAKNEATWRILEPKRSETENIFESWARLGGARETPKRSLTWL